MTDDLPPRFEALLDAIDGDRARTDAVADELNVATTTVRRYVQRLAEYDVDAAVDGDHIVRGDATDADQTDTDDSDATTDDSADSDADQDQPDDASEGVPDLDALQRATIRELPATPAEIDAATDNDVDGHAALERTRAAGIDIAYDSEGGVYYLADDRSKQLRSTTHKSLSAKTKEAKRCLREEQAVLERLPDTTPLSIDDHAPDPDSETLVAAFGDLHFGDRVTNDRGVTVYDADRAHRSADTFAYKVIQTSRQFTADHDECVLAILGDIATGTEIYDTQHDDIEKLLAKQIDDGAAALTRVAVTLREHFDTLRIYAVVGNHGFQSPSAARGSNTDLTCYYWLRDALRREDFDDVELTIGESTHHLNTTVRGWRLHIRHGQDSQQQVDETARSEADWRGWRDKHNFDLGIRGHHHVPSLHWVLNRYPVVTTPSPKPGGEFADRIGDPDASTPAAADTERKLGYVFGVSADRRLTDARMVDGG